MVGKTVIDIQKAQIRIDTFVYEYIKYIFMRVSLLFLSLALCVVGCKQKGDVNGKSVQAKADSATVSQNVKTGIAIQNTTYDSSDVEMMYRISEIEIYPDDLEAYNAILKEETSASVRLEAGVIAIFPMYQKENPNQFRILEIYASQEAYHSHLQTPHFKHYKEATLKMVKSLKLVNMETLDEDTVDLIFRKTGQ
tara:strand:+ start:26071 stop:26655 length:585 start_codon:yes stop_codon:yes gene_type:complete